eukprot:CFRG3126T1
MVTASCNRDTKSVRIRFSEQETHEYAGIWLRDHCKCEHCFHDASRARSLDTYTIPLDIVPKTASIANDKLSITWDDNHATVYELSTLYDAMTKRRQSCAISFWGKSIEENPPVTQYDHLASSKAGVARWVKHITQYGFGLVDGTPSTEEATQRVIGRAFTPMETIYGKWWTFSNAAFDHADMAYTDLHLPSHNDMTYMENPAGLQVFHCIGFNGTGGNTTLVDGFKAADQLKREHPDVYELFSTISLPQKYEDPSKDEYYVTHNPVFVHDPITRELVRVNYNAVDRDTLDASNVDMKRISEIYRAMHTFETILRDSKNVYTFSLAPGRVLIFNNWRVLHGRESFTGTRTLTGCYVSRDEYLAKQRSLLEC